MLLREEDLVVLTEEEDQVVPKEKEEDLVHLHLICTDLLIELWLTSLHHPLLRMSPVRQ